MPLALTTLFGNVKLLSNFCILQNILDRDLNIRILLQSFNVQVIHIWNPISAVVEAYSFFLLKRQCI